MSVGSVTIERSPGYVIVGLRGEHDLATAPEIEEVVSTAIASSGRVIVDLSETTFADSSALRAIVASAHHAEERGRIFLLVLPEDAAGAMQRIVELTQLDRLLTIVATRSEAIEHAEGLRSD